MGKNSSFLFNSIAPIYGLFYAIQKNRYWMVIDKVSEQLDLYSFDNVLDVGCGTGALCSILHEKGLTVTEIDPANKMLKIAKRKPENKTITLI